MSRPDDSDPPPFGEDESTPPDDSDIEYLTPPPVRPEALLQWHARKLTNKITELVDRTNRNSAAPRDHEKRIAKLENQRLDKDLDSLNQRLDDTEADVKAQGVKLEEISAWRWKAIGMGAAGSLLGGIVSAVVIYLITKNL